MRWRTVYDLPSYEVSDTGLVRSIDRTIEQDGRWGAQITRSLKGRILASSTAGDGYRQVSLGAGNDKKRYIHRLVADAFLPKEAGRPEINHKNGDKSDNSVANLERVTASENQRHATHILGRTGGQFVSKLTAEQQAEIVRSCGYAETYGRIAQRFGVSRTTVYRCRKQLQSQKLS